MDDVRDRPHAHEQEDRSVGLVVALELPDSAWAGTGVDGGITSPLGHRRTERSAGLGENFPVGLQRVATSDVGRAAGSGRGDAPAGRAPHPGRHGRSCTRSTSTSRPAQRTSAAALPRWRRRPAAGPIPSARTRPDGTAHPAPGRPGEDVGELVVLPPQELYDGAAGLLHRVEQVGVGIDQGKHLGRISRGHHHRRDGESRLALAFTARPEADHPAGARAQPACDVA